MTCYPHAPAQQDKAAAHSSSPQPCPDPPAAWVLRSLFSWTPLCALPAAPATCHLPSASNRRARPRAHFSLSLPPGVSSSAPGALDAGRIGLTDRSAAPALASALCSRPARPATHFPAWTSLWKLRTTSLHGALHSLPSPSPSPRLSMARQHHQLY